MTKTLSLPLNETTIKKHQANPDVYQLKDPSRPLYLRFSSDRQKGSWLYVSYQSAKQVRRKIGRWPEISCSKLFKALPQIEQGLLLKAEPKALDSFETLGALIEWHLERLALDKSLSAARRQQLKSLYGKHLMPLLGDVSMSELNARLIDERLILKLQKDYKASTLRLVFQALKALTAQAKRRTLIAEDPLQSLVFGQFHSGKMVPKGCALTRADGLALVESLNLEHAPGRLALLMIAFGTRIGETRLARFRDLDWEAGLWHIPAAHTKTRQAHALPVTEIMKSYFHEWKKEGGDYLLGRSLSARDASRCIQSLSGGAWSAHDLRKYARSRWQELGVDYYVAERLLNHGRSQLDSTYLHGAVGSQMHAALTQYHAFLKR